MIRKTLLAVVVTLALVIVSAAPAFAEATPRWTWSDPFPDAVLSGISFPTDTHGWVCGEGGLIAATTDGGTTWVRQSSETTDQINDITFVDALTGWAATASGAILTTTDGGAAWVSHATGSTLPVQEVDFVSADRGWACSSDSVFSTTDGGQTWASTQLIVGSSLTGGRIDFCDAQNGWYVTCADCSFTTDGGETWVPRWTAALPVDISPIGPNAAYFATSGSLGVLDPLDASKDFYVPVGGGDFTSVVGVDSSRAWAVGICGNVSATVDGGHSWISESVEGEHAMWDLAIRGDKGWACGLGVLHTDRTGYTDLHPPVTSTDAPEYTNHSVTVSLSATDPLDSIVATYFRLGAGAWTSGASFAIDVPSDGSADGPFEYSIYSVDVAGNDESPTTHTVFVDTRAPQLVFDPQAPYEFGHWTNQAVTLVGSAGDLYPYPSSGGVTAEFDVDDGSGWVAGSSALVVAPKDHSRDGPHTVAARAVDNAQNASAVQTGDVFIDTRRPTAKAPYVAYARSHGNGTIKCRIVDQRPCSGACIIQIRVWTLSGRLVGILSPKSWFKSNRLVSIGFKCPLKAGKYRFTVKGGDGAGNVTRRSAKNYLVVRSAAAAAAAIQTTSTPGVWGAFELRDALRLGADPLTRRAPGR